jgi:hypothetical protein
MYVATNDGSPIAAKMNRSRLWFVVTTVVPTLLMVGGGLWLAINLVWYQRRFPELVSERDIALAKLEATRADLAKTRAQRDDLVQSNIDLKAENENLLVCQWCLNRSEKSNKE